MGLGAPEVVSSQQPESLTPIHTSADSSINNDKVCGTQGRQNTPRMHAANLIAVQNLGQTAQSQEANHQIPGPPALPVTVHLPNATTSLPLNFNVGGQLLQNLPTNVHAGRIQARVDIPKQSQGTGTQSIQNTHNFLPFYPNVQTQCQAFQGLSTVPSSMSADMIGAPISHNTAVIEDARRILSSLAQIFENAALATGPVGQHPYQPNLNSILMATSSAAPPAVRPNPWPCAQQQASLIQPALPAHHLDNKLPKRFRYQ